MGVMDGKFQSGACCTTQVNESNSGRLKKMMIIYGSLGSLLMSARMDDATMEGSAKV